MNNIRKVKKLKSQGTTKMGTNLSQMISGQQSDDHASSLVSPNPEIVKKKRTRKMVPKKDKTASNSNSASTSKVSEDKSDGRVSLPVSPSSKIDKKKQTKKLVPKNKRRSISFENISQSRSSTPKATYKVVNDTVCISSSDDDVEPPKSIVGLKRKNKDNEAEKSMIMTQTEQTPKKTPRKEKLRAVVAEKCHKITEFFTQTPYKSTEVVEQHIQEIQSSQETDQSQPILRSGRRGNLRLSSSSSSSTSLLVPCTQQPVERRKRTKKTKIITKSTNLKHVSNKYFDEDQKRMPSFYEKTTEDPVTFMTKISQSKQPTIVTGDLNMEEFLHVSIKEEDRVLHLPSKSLTANEINEMLAEEPGEAVFDENRHRWNMELNNVPMEQMTPIKEQNEDSDIQIHHTPEKVVIDLLSDGDDSREPLSRQSISKPTGPVVKTNKRKTVRVCPPYKIVENTTFAVDGFQFGIIEGITHYFLTHYHADHYIGLKKTFDKPLILSEITARLVQSFIKVSPAIMTIVKLHIPIKINGVEITALDANHCPGAVMFYFRLPDGTTILHTGDFRASCEMESEPLFWNTDLNTVYLDTTYLSSKYRFCHQSESIATAMGIVAEYKEKHIGERFLIVCGSYLIGKEKIWMNIAKGHNMKVWAEKGRRQALTAIGDSDMLSVLVDDPKDADVHVLAMQKLFYDQLVEYFSEFEDTFNTLLAIRPSGWEKNSKPQLRNKIHIYGVEYSEHSSYNELERFVRFTKPKTIISTVATSRDLYKTGQVPKEWYESVEQPRRAFQPSISSFLVAGGNKI